MRRLALGIAVVFLFVAPALAELVFPALTGRVVDDAHILSDATIRQLDQKLADYDTGTTNQLVVVTLASLQGDSIEDYGYQLGRDWQIGEKDKNNGVLLIVAPNERKVRIEVGYGLEGVMTDAQSSEIVQGIILPQFRSGHYDQGILAGTQAILDTLGGKSVHRAQVHTPSPVNVIWTLLIMVFLLTRIFTGGGLWSFLGLMMLNSGSRYGSSGGFSGGGFSGGGGSFGGGGASGSW